MPVHVALKRFQGTLRIYFVFWNQFLSNLYSDRKYFWAKMPPTVFINSECENEEDMKNCDDGKGLSSIYIMNVNNIKGNTSENNFKLKKEMLWKNYNFFFFQIFANST